MDERLNERLRRATAEATAQGFAAMIVAPSPDLAYLTGYEPMPMERPTLLVLRAGSRPRDAGARARATARGRIVRPERSWSSSVGPTATTRTPPRPTCSSHRAGSRSATACGPRTSSGCKACCPDLTFEPASPVIGRLRAVKDDDELAALRRAARGADETFRQICSSTFLGRREEEIAADLADLLVQHGHGYADFTIVASGPELRLAAP